MPEETKKSVSWSGSRWTNKQSEITVEEAKVNLHRFTGGCVVTPESLAGISPIKVPEIAVAQATAFCEQLFRPEDLLNVIYKSTATRAADGILKYPPLGVGITKAAGYLAKLFSTMERLAGLGGIWVRQNAVRGLGSGKMGTYRDADIASFQYALLEADDLTLEEQLALFTSLPLPIVSITSSGGRSAHALVRVECNDANAYRTRVKKMLSRLRPFGVDPCNSNPSRLTRLPGAIRKAGGRGDRLQRLLYLNPTASGRAILGGAES